MTTPDDAARTLWQMIEPIRVAMLTTEDGGRLRGRPMVAAQRGFDGTLWFLTRAGSHKVGEVRNDDRVSVSYADPARLTFVSLSGRAHLVRDAAAIGAHWDEAARTWFPRGTDDPEIALLRVDVEAAEVWDGPGAPSGRAFGFVRNAATGQGRTESTHEKLRLG